MNDYHFSYVGEDERGVRVFRSTHKIPPHWMCVFLFCVSGLFLLVPGSFFWSRNAMFFATLFSIIPGLGFGALGFTLQHYRRTFCKLTTSEEACERLDISALELMNIARSRAVLPRFNVNGQDLYDLAELSDAMKLLRPASAPMTTNALLRPVAHMDPQIELLLKPASSKSPPS